MAPASMPRQRPGQRNTPDDIRPPALDAVEDGRLVWASFASFDQAIDELLTDKTEVVSEREAFLLRELQAMLAAENLIGSAKDVVVVPARSAWPEYKLFHAYVCQPGRSFQHVQRLAFYSQGQIHPLVPKILAVHDQVVMQPGRYENELGTLVDHLCEKKLRDGDETYKVFLLSPQDDPETIKLQNPIRNDLRSDTGRPTAFTQNQRYVGLQPLRDAETTSDLIDG